MRKRNKFGQSFKMKTQIPKINKTPVKRRSCEFLKYVQINKKMKYINQRCCLPATPFDSHLVFRIQQVIYQSFILRLQQGTVDDFNFNLRIKIFDENKNLCQLSINHKFLSLKRKKTIMKTSLWQNQFNRFLQNISKIRKNNKSKS